MYVFTFQIREKIGRAIGDMPEHSRIKTLLSGTHINYFHCIQIIDILKETEKETKNIFGSYGSQRMKDWQEIVRLYEKDSVYLAEASQLLSQAIHFDLPGLKKQTSKCRQTSIDCEKREKDCQRKAAEFRSDFQIARKQLGLTEEANSVKNIRKEIISLLDSLPDSHKRIAEQSRKLMKAREEYVGFLENTLEPNMFVKGETLSTLKLLMLNGNVTTYEWIHGEAPISIEEQKFDLSKYQFAGSDDEDDEIDFGIEFGDGDVQLDEEGAIDWGTLNIETDDTKDINWDIDEGADVDAAIILEEDGIAGGVAKDDEALTILDNRRTRTLILDDLSELESFLHQRLLEIEARDEGCNMSLDSSSFKSSETVCAVNDYLTEIKALIDILTTGKLHHLQLIRSSPKYVERLVDSLKQKLNLEEKMLSMAEVAIKKRTESLEEEVLASKRHQVLREKSTELQENIQNEISKRYDGRTVNVLGGV